MNRITAAAGPAGQMLHGMGLDIVMPLVTYYALHAFGADTWIALLASTVVSGVRTLWVAVRERRFNPFSSLMLIVFGVGLVLAFATGDPKLIILKDSAITGVVGLCFLASLFKGRPLTLEAQRAWSPSEAQEIDKAWRESPRARHGYRVTSAVWGAGMLSEAALRAVLIFLLPIDVMVALSTAMWVTTVVLLVLWTRWYANRGDEKERQPETGGPAQAQEA
jgi:hypothetical protein